MYTDRLIMSISPDHTSLPNLFCNEEVDDIVSSDTDIGEILDPVSSDDESSIDFLLDSEIEQMLDMDLCQIRPVVTDRQEALQWTLKVHGYYQFRPETAYLSVNYLDRFLSSHTLPKGKGWPLQLLAVACLSLAAKMEETIVPPLLDMQILEPRFLFKPKTVQRMELLVMARLKWRLRIITPFDFVDYFISKLSSSSPHQTDQYNHVYSRASRIILTTCQVIDFLDYTPSAIAAAAVLLATNRIVDEQKLNCFHERVNRDKVRKCHNLIKQTREQILKPEPPSSIDVVDVAVDRKCVDVIKSSQDSFQITGDQRTGITEFS